MGKSEGAKTPEQGKSLGRSRFDDVWGIGLVGEVTDHIQPDYHPAPRSQTGSEMCSYILQLSSLGIPFYNQLP